MPSKRRRLRVFSTGAGTAARSVPGWPTLLRGGITGNDRAAHQRTDEQIGDLRDEFVDVRRVDVLGDREGTLERHLGTDFRETRGRVGVRGRVDTRHVHTPDVSARIPLAGHVDGGLLPQRARSGVRTPDGRTLVTAGAGDCRPEDVRRPVEFLDGDVSDCGHLRLHVCSISFSAFRAVERAAKLLSLPELHLAA